jgi:hypothetical protein
VPSIAILDDRKEGRETIERVVRSTLKRMQPLESWSVVMDAPPSRERDVLQWLDENDATVLVTDWRLNEGAKGKRVVTYEADRLIKEIRNRRPTFPIFVITGFATEVQAHMKDVENIFSRTEFLKNAESIVPQMVRAGLRRYDEQRELLKKMDVLARVVASGNATADQRAELQSLHGYYQSDLPAMMSLGAVLGEFEKVKDTAEALRRKVQRRLDRKKGTK